MSSVTINCQSGKNADRLDSVDNVSNFNDAIFIVDNNGCISYANEKLFRLLGTDGPSLLGKPYTHLFRELAALCENEQQAMGDLQIALNKLKAPPTSGQSDGNPSLRYVRVEFFSLQASDREWGWGGILRLSDTKHDYYPPGTEDFLALTNTLRSSLVSIIGCSTIISGDIGHWNEDELRGFVATIADYANHSLRLLENVRDSWIVGRNGLDLNCGPIDLRNLIQHVLSQLANHSAGLEIEIAIPDTLPQVDVDIIRLSRAFHSLFHSILNVAVHNSIRIASHQAHSMVQLDIYYQGKNVFSEFATGYVNDPSKYIWRIEDQSYEMKLELHVIQNILSAHGGLLWTDRSLDQGTVIHIGLPLTQRERTRSLQEPSAQLRKRLEIQSQLSGPTGKVLVVESEPRVSTLLKRRLEQAGHVVTCSNVGRLALELVAIDMPDVILLSWHLPDMSGLNLCTELRELTTVPIIVIADALEEKNVVRSLNAGADDYILKPIQVTEVLARIEARLRRSYLPNTMDHSSSQQVFKTGELEIDYVYRQVKVRGTPVELTPIEYKLLYHLAANAGRILTHEQLMSKVWGPMFNQEHHFLWVNISRLRSKLEDNPSDPKYIATERGVGYSLMPF
jgi:DNA-binding response OmpR family regulator/signal transduction histidine kinase